VELWCRYDFRDGYDGVTDPSGRRLTGVHKVVITVAEGVLIQFRLNPFDRKFVPYGVAQLNRNGHEMLGVGPYDNAVIVNAQLDRYHSNVLRHSDLAVAPMIATEGDSDLTGSILGERAGTVFKNVGKVHEIRVGDLPQSVAYMHNFFRREVEEITGAVRLWVGTGDGQDTATQDIQSLQESNRRLRSYIRAIGNMWRQVGLIIYWMNGQFSTRRHKFQVLGKASQVLGDYHSVTPDMFQDEVDIKFVGMESLNTYGQRSAGMLQWANVWGPMLPNMPDVDLTRLAKLQWEHLVGKDPNLSIFKEAEPPYMQMDQKEENLHLRRGNPVHLSVNDDDVEHLKEMERAGMLEIAADPDAPPFVAQEILNHYRAHEKARDRKEAEERSRQIQAQREASLMAMKNGSEPGNGTAPVPGGMAASSRGITNGVQTGNTVARAGREGAGVSQEQAQ
jgi:hypothetical protein